MPSLNNTTKARPYLFYILYLCLNLIACHEDSMNEITDSSSDQQGNPTSNETNHDHQTQQQQGEAG